MKKRRRIALGDIVTIVFENTDTMRFQVQEMARAERMLTDEAIAHEVETYNELIPESGELSGTLFIELTEDAALREWLPKLRGIEFNVYFELGVRGSGSRVKAVPRDEERLTRDDITSTVHYLKFPFDAEQRHWHSTFVIDIGETFEQKVKAVECYRSQFDDARFSRVRHFLSGYNTYNGSRCGFLYGELFALPHPVGASDLMTLLRGGKGSPAPVQLPGQDHLPTG